MKTLTVLKYPGAKNRLADKIIGMFPDGYRNMTYVEPFFGSGAVFFRKAPSAVETVNDLDGNVVNLFKQIRENGDELSRLIAYTPWSREEYELSRTPADNPLEKARRFLVRSWMSIGASNNKTGWRHNIKADSFSIGTWSDLPEVIRETARRFMPRPGNLVQIENRNAFELIERYGRPYTLMYLDPPYVMESRKGKKRYNVKMNDAAHIRLCELIRNSQAKIILSGYENGIYEEYLRGFHRVSLKTRDEAGNTRNEILWSNFTTTGNLFEDGFNGVT